MSKRPQFSLKALLVIIAVLAVPLGMMVSGSVVLFALGYHGLFVAFGGSLGYLLGGSKGTALGSVLGVCSSFIVWCLLPLLP